MLDMKDWQRKSSMLIVGIPKEGNWNNGVGCVYLQGLFLETDKENLWLDGRRERRLCPRRLAREDTFRKAVGLKSSLSGSQVEIINHLCGGEIIRLPNTTKPIHLK